MKHKKHLRNEIFFFALVAVVVFAFSRWSQHESAEKYREGLKAVANDYLGNKKQVESPSEQAGLTGPKVSIQNISTDDFEIFEVTMNEIAVNSIQAKYHNGLVVLSGQDVNGRSFAQTLALNANNIPSSEDVIIEIKDNKVIIKSPVSKQEVKK